jgi:hypothetical protein
MKLPRFSSYKQPDKDTSEETKPDMGWSQHVTLPLSPAVYDAYKQARGESDLVTKSTKPVNTPPRDNEHLLSTLGDLIRALDLDGKEVIDYILAHDLVKGVPSEEP